jgi:hypothetical protein
MIQGRLALWGPTVLPCIGPTNVRGIANKAVGNEMAANTPSNMANLLIIFDNPPQDSAIVSRAILTPLFGFSSNDFLNALERRIFSNISKIAMIVCQ